jgi:hypothetical protein
MIQQHGSHLYLLHPTTVCRSLRAGAAIQRASVDVATVPLGGVRVPSLAGSASEMLH